MTNAKTTQKRSSKSKKHAKKEIEFNFRLLAFGVLASQALDLDIQNSDNRPVKAAAQKLRTDTKPGNFVKNAQNFLIALGFPPTFVKAASRRGMPWTLINRSGIVAMQAVLEADSINYPDGGCLDAILAAVQALGTIKP